VGEISEDHIERNKLESSFNDWDLPDDPPYMKQSPYAKSPFEMPQSKKSPFEMPQSKKPSTLEKRTMESLPTKKKHSPVLFFKGDAINHTAFGHGVIINITAAGGDALLEIAFDEAGTKRLMLKSAERYLSKRV